MANRKLRRPTVATTTKTPALPDEKKTTTSTLSLRLPANLREIAQTCAHSTGVSLNGLICTALADYLISRGYKVHS